MRNTDDASSAGPLKETMRGHNLGDLRYKNQMKIKNDFV